MHSMTYLMQPARRDMCASTSAVYWMSMSDSATMMLLRTTEKGERPSSYKHDSMRRSCVSLHDGASSLLHSLHR